MDWKQIISDYQPEDDIEAAEKASFLQFIDAFGDKAFARENLPGHFSASAWVVNPARDKVLMIFTICLIPGHGSAGMLMACRICSLWRLRKRRKKRELRMFVRC